MKILLVGAGGREHAFAWKLAQSAQCEKLYISPGNAGTAQVGTNLNIAGTDFEQLAAACLGHAIDLVLVGPEEPLVKGIFDYFSNREDLRHIHVIGPDAASSQLEGSKAFAKAFMQRHNIPTASYREFTADNYDDGVNYIQALTLPIVLKADGLAAGKGVLICQTHIEAAAEFELMIRRSKFGEAGKKVVIESFLKGIEISVFALTDGKNYVLLPEAKDYKRIGEGDQGLNTGGMGAVSPVPFFDEDLRNKVIRTIVEPTINGFAKENMKYKGFVFFGLMIDNGEPMVIEYNCRMGDPETEAVLPRLQTDLVDLLKATAEERLNELTIETDERMAVTVIAVSGGYPNDYEKGKKIIGLKTKAGDESLVFHAGTTAKENDVVTNGGRVLAITSYGKDILSAREKSLKVLDEIYFEDMNFRKDIGFEFV